MAKTLDKLILQYQQICERLPMGMILVDAQKKVLLWNGWMQMHTNIQATKAVGQVLQSLYPEPLSERFQWALEQALNYSHPQVLSTTLNEYVFPIPLNKGTFAHLEWMQQAVEILPIRQDGQKEALIIVKDVSINVMLKNTLMAIAAKFEKNSLIDSLTQCYNRRYLYKYLKQELVQARRLNYPVICCLLDIDYFKPINDELGHDAGDRALIKFVQQIQSVIRSEDHLFRYGGEEFICIFTKVALEDVLDLVERIRIKLKKTPIHMGANPRYITCSVGISYWIPGDPSQRDDELISMADKQLYKAKNSGRNKICYD